MTRNETEANNLWKDLFHRSEAAMLKAMDERVGPSLMASIAFDGTWVEYMQRLSEWQKENSPKKINGHRIDFQKPRDGDFQALMWFLYTPKIYFDNDGEPHCVYVGGKRQYWFDETLKNRLGEQVEVRALALRLKNGPRNNAIHERSIPEADTPEGYIEELKGLAVAIGMDAETVEDLEWEMRAYRNNLERSIEGTRNVDTYAVTAVSDVEGPYLRYFYGSGWRMVSLKEGEPVAVGRSFGHEIVLAEEKLVSGDHAEFLQLGGVVTVRDLGSTNGTYVNGKLIGPRKPVPLEEGDRVALVGPDVVEFRVRLGGDAR